MAWHYIDTASPVWTNYAPNSNTDQIDNATEIWNYFRSLGYSEQATAGILGNAQYESTLNPAQWEYGGYVGNLSAGYGLFQWTPASRYVNLYCNTYGYSRLLGSHQVEWVETQTIGGLDGDQWNGVVAPYTWAEFKVSIYTPTDLAYAFCRNWERGGWNTMRATNAEYWYNYFTGSPPPQPPDPPPPPPVTGTRIPIWLFVKLTVDKQKKNIHGKKEIKKGIYFKW